MNKKIICFILIALLAVTGCKNSKSPNDTLKSIEHRMDLVSKEQKEHYSLFSYENSKLVDGTYTCVAGFDDKNIEITAGINDEGMVTFINVGILKLDIRNFGYQIQAAEDIFTSLLGESPISDKAFDQYCDDKGLEEGEIFLNRTIDSNEISINYESPLFKNEYGDTYIIKKPNILTFGDKIKNDKILSDGHYFLMYSYKGKK